MPVDKKREWFQDRAFWRDLYPFMFPKDRFEAAPKEAPLLVRLTRPRGKDVLDLCCGPGRYSIALAKRGFRVTGVDRTRSLLARARANARAEGADVEWIERDMREFARPDSFDLVIHMFTSFGFFDDPRDDQRVLGNVVQSLRPGGAYLLDVMGKERLARSFSPSLVQELPNGARLVLRHSITDDWTRIQNEWILVRGERAKTYRFKLRIYSGQELRDRMGEAGFTDVKLYGGLRGEPYGLNSERLIAVGRRPGDPVRPGSS